MPSILTSPFEINGVVSTDRSVVQNINDLATAAGAWVTYDISQGKWAVIINRAGSSVKSFNDSNIIGSINVSGTGVTELYNSVKIEYPHKDLRDQFDTLELKIATADRFNNELDNTLNMKIDCINNPVQAQYLASVELKQSRVDKVVQFRTDYSSLGLKAGDLIDVTSEMYGYTNKVFRITNIAEDDSDGFLALSITALEYDADVYDPNTGLTTVGLSRSERSRQSGITAYTNNTSIAASNNAATANSLTNAFNDPANAALIVALLTAFGNKIGSGGGNIAAVNSFTGGVSTGTVASVYNAYAGTATLAGFAGNTSLYVTLGFNLTTSVKLLYLTINTPLGGFSYQYGDASGTYIRTGLYAYLPSIINLYYNGNYVQSNTVDWQTPNITIILPNAPAGSYEFRIAPLATYDLDQRTAFANIHPYNFTVDPQASGDGISLAGLAYYF